VHLTVIIRITGILLMLFSLVLGLPALLALALGEDTTIGTFVTAFAVTLSVGILLWLPTRQHRDLHSRDGFMITVLFYLGLSLFGALPFYLSDTVSASFVDAAFESMSGLTTTGATVLSGLDSLPRSILMYRQLLQWLGGMGIIVLAVAVLPMLGIGGMQLYRAESPGPGKDSKLTPRITETAKALWYIYLGLTVACALSYWAAGMSAYDAIAHSFSTVAIGGFSTHDASMGFFNDPWIESVAMVFMVLAGINFGLHFMAIRRRTLIPYLRDAEFRFYLAVLTGVAVTVCALLWTSGVDQPWRHGVFQTISIATTTGFTTENFSVWPSVTPFLLMFAAFAGGCGGSTAGGIKMMRVLLIYKQGMREVMRLIHPSGVFPVKLNRRVVSDRVVEAVWGFFAVYVILFLTLVCVVLALAPLDFVTAFSAVGACLNNLGPGLGDVALNYQALDASVKWVLIFTMLLGRLEIFTLLVLLTPAFWRR
jgi:trk system potassium uptake protein TrkH